MTYRPWLHLMLMGTLGGCGEAARDSYFPLEPGLRYEYQVSEVTERGTVQRRYGIENVGSRSGAGEPIYVRRTDNGLEYHHKPEGLGATRIAMRVPVELEPIADVPPRTVLPAQPVVGAEWRAQTRPYLLKRNVSDGIDLTRDHSIDMTYRIADTGASVTVPAGTFERCVHVIGEAKLRIFVDGRRGYSEVPLRTDEWYARGVGLVRLQRREIVESSDMLAGGELNMVLLRRPAGN